MISFANLTYAASRVPHAEVNGVLFAEGGLPARSLPVSAILEQRSAQVAELIGSWDAALGDEILADNFFLDRSLDRRRASAAQLLEEAGPITAIEGVRPLNQLRGTFVMHGAAQDIRVFFTLSPEKPARVQRLDLRLQ